MKKLNVVVLSCIAVAGIMSITGCQTTGGKAAQEEADAALAQAQAETAAVQAELDAALAEADIKTQAAKRIPGATLTQTGTLLFAAQGQSVAVAEEGPLGVAKARLAAETIAKANLLELLKGALISGSVTVGDMMFQSQLVSTTVTGWLGGVTLETVSTVNEQSRLPNAEPVDQMITAKATLELSMEAWENLSDYVE
ncbi:MAG: hypothetical protein KAU94_09345 [Verrucomicrobia bacterium]|nr:hypothetical protein [Verrucomicrobiota bacterium]